MFFCKKNSVFDGRIFEDDKNWQIEEYVFRILIFLTHVEVLPEKRQIKIISVLFCYVSTDHC